MSYKYSIVKSFENEHPNLAKNVACYRELGGYDLLIEYEDGSAIVYSDFDKTFRRLPNDPFNMTDSERRYEFGTRLRRKMFVKRISQLELSRRTGISNVMLSRYINGKSDPSYITVEKICNALGCDMDELRYIK